METQNVKLNMEITVETRLIKISYFNFLTPKLTRKTRKKN